MFKSNSKSYRILVAICSIAITAAIGYLIVWAGSLTPSDTPGDTMYTLDDIYYKLQTSGTAGTYDLDSPGTPTSTMYTLEDVYDATPDFHDNPGDASNSDVCNLKTFYTDSSNKLTGERGCTGNGESCSTGSECLSGQCVDDVCCETACTGICRACDVSSGLCGNPSTDWGADLYGCVGTNKRCDGGECRICNDGLYSYFYDDGCSDCAGQGGNACWRRSTVGGGPSCNTVCENYGGCIASVWNDGASCPVGSYFIDQACGPGHSWGACSGSYGSGPWLNLVVTDPGVSCSTYKPYNDNSPADDDCSDTFANDNFYSLCVCQY